MGVHISDKINKRSGEQNSNDALPIVYLFFIIYSKSIIGQLQLKIVTKLT